MAYSDIYPISAEEKLEDIMKVLREFVEKRNSISPWDASALRIDELVEKYNE